MASHCTISQTKYQYTGSMDRNETYRVIVIVQIQIQCIEKTYFILSFENKKSSSSLVINSVLSIANGDEPPGKVPTLFLADVVCIILKS